MLKIQNRENRSSRKKKSIHNGRFIGDKLIPYKRRYILASDIIIPIVVRLYIYSHKNAIVKNCVPDAIDHSYSWIFLLKANSNKIMNHNMQLCIQQSSQLCSSRYYNLFQLRIFADEARIHTKGKIDIKFFLLTVISISFLFEYAFTACTSLHIQ